MKALITVFTVRQRKETLRRRCCSRQPEIKPRLPQVKSKSSVSVLPLQLNVAPPGPWTNKHCLIVNIKSKNMRHKKKTTHQILFRFVFLNLHTSLCSLLHSFLETHLSLSSQPPELIACKLRMRKHGHTMHSLAAGHKVARERQTLQSRRIPHSPPDPKRNKERAKNWHD